MAGSAEPPADAAAVTAAESAGAKSTVAKSGFAPWAAAEQCWGHATPVAISGIGSKSGKSLSYFCTPMSERQNVHSLTPSTQIDEYKVRGP